MVQWLSSGTYRAPHIEGHRRLFFRLIIGLLQGASAYGLYRITSFDDLNTTLLLTWALVTAYAPPLWLAAIGQISFRSTLIWGALATALVAGLGLSSGMDGAQHTTLAVLAVCLPVALFCAHHLAIPAINQRSLIAPYETYYEAAWKAGIQLVLALMFLGVFWAILFLGSMLFKAIGIGLIEDIITDALFACIVTPLFFALGVELSDVRDSLTQGIRTVALTLLSWLLPIAVFIAGAFLITLPIAGMSELHSSLSPAGLMLTASAGLILLINTVYQDGAEHLSGARFLRLTLRIGIVLLVPMTAFALWAVSVRVGQYGLTLPRIVALTGAVLGFLYAVGYALGLVVKNRNGGWLPLFETTNVVVGLITTLTLVGYSTPWLNPVKLAMNDQISRIESGKLKEADIPYNWLARSAGDRGRAILEDFAKSEDAVMAAKAQRALDGDYINPSQTPNPLNIKLYPQGTAIPQGLEQAMTAERGYYECRTEEGCTARLYDIDADGQQDFLIWSNINITVFSQDENGTWKLAGRLNNRVPCYQNRVNEEDFRNGVIAKAPPVAVSPVSIGSAVLDYAPAIECPPATATPAD